MRRILWSISLIFGVGLTTIYGQGGFGQIGGKVADPNGQSVAGAKITATNVETNVATDTISTDAGDYQLLRLSPGRYTLTVEAANFKKLERSGVTVQVADRLTIDLPLEVGQVSEVVSVTAEAPLLRTQDAQSGEVIDNKQIQNLPQINRDPLQLLLLAGNVQGDGSRAVADSDTRINGGRTQGVQYLIDGVDAGKGRDHGVSNVLVPNMDAVGEFKVITNGISAEYGRLSGGAVELISLSGTNSYHGQVFGYFQDDVLNANSWEQNRLGNPRGPFRQNNFGGTIGGPVVVPRFGEGGRKTWSGKDRLFFFFNYDGLRFTQVGQLRVANVPTELERRGDFSQTIFNGVPAAIYDMFGPTATIPDPTDPSKTLLVRTQQYPGNVLPANRINPVSQALLNLMPLPNRTPRAGTSNQENYVAPQDTTNNRDTWGVRLDYRLTDSSSLFGRFTRSNSLATQSRWRGVLGTAGQQEEKGAFGVNLGYDWTISPTLTLSARAGGHYNPFTAGYTLADGFSSASIPFDPITRSLIGDSLPGIGASGLGDIVDSWGNKPATSTQNSTTYNATVAMSKILTRHTLKFGYEHRRYYDNFADSGSGQVVMIGSSTNRTVGDTSWSNQDQANGVASFLYGYNHYYEFNGPRSRALNLNYHAAYIQDDFRLAPKLTLGLGVRWDMETPTTERNNKLYFWDPSAPAPFTVRAGYNFNQALADAGYTAAEIARIRRPSWLANGFPDGAIRIAGTPEFPGRAGQELHPWQFAPRVSAAYQVNDKTVLRGSFAQIYLPTTGDRNGLAAASSALRLSDGGNVGWHATQDGFQTMLSNWNNPFYRSGLYSTYQRDTGVANFQSTGGQAEVGALSRDSHMPHEFTWSFGVQREIGANIVVEAQYSANMGRQLLARDLISRFPRDLFVPENRETYGASRTVASPFNEQTNYGDKVPLALLQYQYPYYGPVQVLGANIGRSNYQSLNLRATKRFSRGFDFLFNYTLSRLKDNVGGPDASGGGVGSAGGTGGKEVQSVDTIRDVYGLSPLDEKHVLVFSYNVEFPIGRGRRFLGDPQGFGARALDYVVGGWQLAGITRYRSGRPVVFEHYTLNNDIRVESTFASFANPNDTNLLAGGGSSDSFLYSTGDRVTASTPRIFDLTKFAPAQAFTYGTLPSVYDALRHPGNINESVSLLKRFNFGEGTRYFQVRMEAANIFNRRGLGRYRTNLNDNYFGLITGAGNIERRIQLSGRFVF